MSPREESIIKEAQSLALSLLKGALVGVPLTVKVLIETPDSINVNIEIGVDK